MGSTKKAEGLSQQEEAFAQHFALHNSQVDAYIHAFNPKSKSRKSITEMASRMMARNSKILDRVNELRKAVADLAAENFKVDAAWVLERLFAELNADVADLFDERNALRSVRDWPEVWRLGLVAGVDIESRVTEDGEFISVSKVRLSDRVKRMELLGRHIEVKAFLDRKEVMKSNAATVPVSATAEFVEEVARKGEGGTPS